MERLKGYWSSGQRFIPSQKGKFLFEVTPLTLAELLPHLDWFGSIPTVLVRISKINRQRAPPADFSEVPFEKVWLHAQKLYTRLKVRDKVAKQTEARKLSNQGSIRLKDYVLNRGGLWGSREASSNREPTDVGRCHIRHRLKALMKGKT